VPADAGSVRLFLRGPSSLQLRRGGSVFRLERDRRRYPEATLDYHRVYGAGPDDPARGDLYPGDAAKIGPALGDVAPAGLRLGGRGGVAFPLAGEEGHPGAGDVRRDP